MPRRPADPQVADLLSWAWCLEDCPQLRALVDGLAGHVVAGFRLRARHLVALDDWASWGDEGPPATLRRLARSVAWQVLEEDRTDPDAFVRTARRRLEGLLGARRTEDDPSLVLLLAESVAAPDKRPGPDHVLEAEELREALLGHPDLSAGERAVVAARIELGAGAAGADVASLAGVSSGVERELTRRVRKKLSGLR